MLFNMHLSLLMSLDFFRLCEQKGLPKRGWICQRDMSTWRVFFFSGLAVVFHQWQILSISIRQANTAFSCRWPHPGCADPGGSEGVGPRHPAGFATLVSHHTVLRIGWFGSSKHINIYIHSTSLELFGCSYWDLDVQYVQYMFIPPCPIQNHQSVRGQSQGIVWHRPARPWALELLASQAPTANRDSARRLVERNVGG